MFCINRRQLVGIGASALFGCSLASRLLGAVVNKNFEKALAVLRKATDSGQVRAAAIYARCQGEEISESFGQAKSTSASFLLGSISKPISIAALMVLYDQQKFALDDPVRKYIPEFTGEGKQLVTIRQLLTHVSGLPDQLPNNAELRSSHAPLSDFVKSAIRVPLGFQPGTRYEYSSMAILLAAEIAQRLAAQEIRQLVNERVLQPLNMQHSALGLGKLTPGEMMSAQVEFGAAESGGGTPESRGWDWNSDYWRALGSPWGGVHASAEDVAKFLDSFTKADRQILLPETAASMVRNHNPVTLESRGLGFDVGMESYCPGCSKETFGHTGSTGTIAWSDPIRDRLCVVLTTLPARALDSSQHPRQLSSNLVCAQS